MKKMSLLVVIVFVLTSPLWAELVSDPNDELYTWLSIWEERGYIQKLPPLRPYPIQLVREVLKAVQEKGSPADAERAGMYLKQVDVSVGDAIPNRTLPAPLNFSIENQDWTKFDAHRADALASIIIQGVLCDLFSFSGRASWGGTLATDGFHGPEWTKIGDESVSGGGQVGVGGLELQAKNIGVGGVAVGTADLYFQAGLMRSSFGPFFENGAVIGPQAPAAGHFSLNYRNDWITVSSVMLVLYPKYYWEKMVGIEELDKTNEKYLIVHSYNFYPLDWLEFGILQSVVYGGRFNPTYMLPFLHMFFAQQLYGDEDNSFLGLYGRVKLPLNFQFKFMCYIDDFNADAFLGQDEGGSLFNLNSGQNKVALQAGFTWTPDMEILKRVSLDYLLVTPYTYTHFEGYKINYLMYTHDGEGIGTILEPNSDQITLSVFLEPVFWCGVDVWGRFARHGNASEDFPPGDGSYYDDGFDDTSGKATFKGPSRFLIQDVIEYVFQTGCSVNFNFGLGWGELNCGAGYTFEMVQNKNLVAGNREVNNFVTVFVKLIF